MEETKLYPGEVEESFPFLLQAHFWATSLPAQPAAREPVEPSRGPTGGDKL